MIAEVEQLDHVELQNEPESPKINIAPRQSSANFDSENESEHNNIGSGSRIQANMDEKKS